MEIKYRVGSFDYDTFADAEVEAVRMLHDGSKVIPIKKILLEGSKVALGGIFYINQLYVTQKRG
jgi:hypothetical protein